MENYSFMSKFKKYVSSSVVLIVCTVLALICANVPAIKEWYFQLWEHEVNISVGNFNFFSHNGHPMSVMAVINDFLMAIFFLSVGLEIKRDSGRRTFVHEEGYAPDYRSLWRNDCSGAHFLALLS